MGQGWGPPQGYGPPPQQPGYGPPQQGYGPPMGAIEIHTSFMFLQWILFLVSTHIEINGMVQVRPWGTHRFDLPAGHYYIRAWFPYMFRDQCGIGVLQVPVNPGMITCLSYEAPFFMFSDGTMRPTGMKPMGGMPMLPGPPGYY